MAKYRVCYAPSFFNAMDKLDWGTQKVIAKWIDKHLVDVDFPKSPGKYLTGQLSGYVRFRVGSYHIITRIDEDKIIMMNIHVAKRSEVYRFKGNE